MKKTITYLVGIVCLVGMITILILLDRGIHALWR